MRVLLTGGGTAGHTNPAVAIGEYIMSRSSSSEILFVGRENGDENRAVTAAGFKLKTINIQGLVRSLDFQNIKRIALALGALKDARLIIKEFMPDVIVGTGGYVSWPCLHTGIKMNIPTFVHESNVAPGLVTRAVAKKCNRVLINLDGTRDYLKRQDNIVTVGNPLRLQFGNISKSDARRMLGIKHTDFFILSFGGSGGSDKMNEACIGLMKSHSQRSPKVKHTHAVGRRYFERYLKSEPALCRGGDGCKIVSYIDNMPIMLKACDLAIARCGAMTLSELACVGVPSILVPSPNVTDNHQYKNAMYLVEKNAGVMIEETELSERRLLDTVRRLEVDCEMRCSMSKSIKGLFASGAEEKIYNELISATGGK